MQVLLLALYGILFLVKSINIAGIMAIIAVICGLILASIEKDMKINSRSEKTTIMNAEDTAALVGEGGHWSTKSLMWKACLRNSTSEAVPKPVKVANSFRITRECGNG